MADHAVTPWFFSGMLKECNGFEILVKRDSGLRFCLYIIVIDDIPSREK